MFYMKELYAELRSIREVARRTGHDRKTVRMYIHSQERPRYRPRSPRPSKLDPFKPTLVTCIAEGMLNCNDLLDEIRALGPAPLIPDKC
ncbi:HTH IS21-type domain-containing protein [Hydrogenibacillus schlegelii]